MTTTEKSGLAAAMAKLQKKLPKVGKSQTADTGSYTYKYADLATINEAVMPLLGELGLSFVCRPTFSGDRFVLAYTLQHESGESIDGEYPLPNGNPQVIGSALSYGRRYVLCAVTGVAPEEGDDDGRAAAEHHRQNPPITQQQLKHLHAAFTDLGITDRDEGLAYIADTIGRDVASSKDLTRAEASNVIDRLRTQLDAAVAADKAAAESSQPAAAEGEQPTLPENGEKS